MLLRSNLTLEIPIFQYFIAVFFKYNLLNDSSLKLPYPVSKFWMYFFPLSLLPLRNVPKIRNLSS